MTHEYINLLQQIATALANADSEGLTDQQTRLHVQYASLEIHSMYTIRSQRALLQCVWRDIPIWQGKYRGHAEVSCKGCVLENKSCDLRTKRQP